MPKKVDLTHTLHKNVPTWAGDCGFVSAIKLDYDKQCRVQNIKMHAGIGTHIDAPAHFIAGAQTVAELSLRQLIAPLVVIDVSLNVASCGDYMITCRDIELFEQQYAHIKKGDLVVFNTGWHLLWGDNQKYRNCDKEGVMHFPSISVEVAQLLLNRDVVGVGIDTLSPDCSQTDFPVHEAMLGAGKYIVENVANLNEIASTGFTAYVLPIKAQPLVEAPVRFIAMQHA